jgi:hypothetical protein
LRPGFLVLSRGVAAETVAAADEPGHLPRLDIAKPIPDIPADL